MSYEQSRKYDLNSAITALNEEGEFDDKAHFEKVKPVWLRVRGKDGITACYITRYGIEVKYMPEVITEAQAEEIVREAIEWGASNEELGLFPLRGDKTPGIVPPRHATVEPTEKQKVHIKFGTHLIAYPPSGEKQDEWDSKRFLALVHPVLEKLLSLDGIVGHILYIDAITIIVHTNRTMVQDVVNHVERVLLEAKRDDPMILPFIESFELALTYTSSNA